MSFRNARSRSRCLPASLPLVIAGVEVDGEGGGSLGSAADERVAGSRFRTRSDSSSSRGS